MSTTLSQSVAAPPEVDSKFSRIQRWMRGETPGPWEMQVHPTNRCNLKCRHCWERRAEREIGMSIYDKTAEVSEERLLRLVDEAAEMGVREWTLVGGGEPMVRDELVIEMCTRIHGHGMRANLHTNGTRFKQEHFERLIAAGLDRIRVSIDGPTQEMNDAVRGGGFDRAVSNLKLLKAMKESAGVTYPIVSLHPVITNVIHRDLAGMIDLAVDVGAEGVSFTHLSFEKPDEEDGRMFLLSEAEMAEVPRHVKSAQERARAKGIHDSFDFVLPDDLRSEKGKPVLGRTCCNDGRFTDAACFESWLTSVIHVTGQMGPCCVSWDASAQNIKEMSLRDAWLGPFMQDVRKHIVSQDLPRFCSFCPTTYITPRSEIIRHDLLESLPRSEHAQWDKWAALAPQEAALLLSQRLRENLRHRGVRRTLNRAWEWVLTRGR